MYSVVIPAHNEAATLGRLLRGLLDGSAPDEFEIVVAANGCSDETEVVASSFGHPVRVVATPRASKTLALNLGDAAARHFPRFYVDADVELDVAALREVVAALDGGAALIAAPSVVVRTGSSSWPVRAFYRVWCELPSVRDDVVGRGVYAVSRQGRQRFDEFPDLIADDHFVRTRYRPSERTVVRGCTSYVDAPRTFRALVRRQARVRAGNRHVDGLDGTSAEDVRGLCGLWVVVSAEPSRASDLPAYLAVVAASRYRSRRLARGADPWGRDDSRSSSPAAG
jgi:glycosyltransferase involved in cell wall biosynthesis